jgi:hypothetical protein
MKTYTQPVEMKAVINFTFGSFPKTYIGGSIGDVFTVIGETKAYYITDNPKNNKLPKYIVDSGK